MDQTLVPAETLAFAKVNLAGPVNAKDTMNAANAALGQNRPATESTVAQQNVPWAQILPKLLE